MLHICASKNDVDSIEFFKVWYHWKLSEYFIVYNHNDLEMYFHVARKTNFMIRHHTITPGTHINRNTLFHSLNELRKQLDTVPTDYSGLYVMSIDLEHLHKSQRQYM